MIKNFVLFLGFAVVCSARSDVITGTFSDSFTNQVSVVDSSGSNGIGLQFQTGNAGGSNTWRLNSFTVDLFALGANATNIKASVFLYNLTTKNASSWDIGIAKFSDGISNATVSNIVGDSTTILQGDHKQIKFDLTSFGTLAGPVLQSNTNYMLGINFSNDGSTNMAARGYIGSDPSQAWTTATGWSVPNTQDYYALQNPDGNGGIGGPFSVNSTLAEWDSILGNGTPIYSLQATAVPEPGTLSLFCLALCCFGYFGYRHQCKRRQVAIVLS